MRLRALALAGLSVLLLGGCSTTVVGTAHPAADAARVLPAADRTGPALADAAADALEAAGSVRVQGTIATYGGKAEVDLRMQGGDMDAIVAADGLTMRIVLSGGWVFVQAGADFYLAQGVPAAKADSVAGLWVRMPNDPLIGADEMTLAAFVAELRSPTGATIADEVTAGQLDGRPVWLVDDSEGGVLYVAADGPPYPLLMTTDGDGSARLSAFGAVEPIVPPAEYVDLGE